MSARAPEDQYDPEVLRDRLADVESRLRAACDRADRRRDEVTLVAVSKTHPAGAVRTLAGEGVTRFGASYVQEWQDKDEECPDQIHWHFVGHLQSNKAKYVADSMEMIHSVDRRSVSKQLHRRSEGEVDVLLQIKLGDEDSKSGVVPDELPDLLETVTDYPSLRIRGLMTLPPYVDDPEENRPRFRRMRELLGRGRRWLDRHGRRDSELFEHLSMGMSADFEVAVEEGATLVRIGTALFGPRRD